MSSAIHDAAAIAAIEVTKVSSFIAYLERHAPGVGVASRVTSELTEVIKKQIETTGSCPLLDAFEQVSLWSCDSLPGILTFIPIHCEICFLLGKSYCSRSCYARICSCSRIYRISRS
jgi:hypothetical protein